MFTVQGKLPSLNEYVNAERTNKYMAAKIKKEATELVAWQVKGIAPIKGCNDYTFTWYVPNKRSDPDNLSYGVKYLLDGLQLAGKLENDSMRYVRSLTHFFEIGDYKVEVQVDGN